MRGNITIICLWGFENRKDMTSEIGALSQRSMQRPAFWCRRFKPCNRFQTNRENQEVYCTMTKCFSCCERPSLQSCRRLRYIYVTVEGDFIKVSSAILCFAQAAPPCVQRNILLHRFPTSRHTKGWLEPSGTVCHCLEIFTYVIAHNIGATACIAAHDKDYI